MPPDVPLRPSFEAEVLHDREGNPIDSVLAAGIRRLAVDAIISGAVPVPIIPFVANLANTVAPLGASEVYTSSSLVIDDPASGSMGASVMDAIAVLSGGGELKIQVSKDDSNWYDQEVANVDPGVPTFISELRLAGKYARAVLTDGGAGSPTVVLHADVRPF